MRYHALQHIAFETPGLLADEIRRRGDEMRTTALYNGESLPATADFDVLVVMGGPMSIHDEAEYPWLRGEKELIGAAIREGKKVLGICLGAQLIAAVCGGRVYRAGQKEIGWWPVSQVGDGFCGEADGWQEGGESVVFHWHGETFDLPEGAVLLASTDVCVNQAFSLGDTVLGIQFHPEVTEEIIRGMVEHEGWELAEAAGAPYVQGAERILEGARELGMKRGGDLWVEGTGSPWVKWLLKWL
ncbi:MAG TPA: gamma-glutamyl-gamma-aminobutyrate hydrolase family protein [Puia sp.]|jgi:GMP synthase-like glutamine amidotransferase|nr:gamma-glutamyl-gamma-aminobutyrate hydrolase family protein [Puia sp.]